MGEELTHRSSTRPVFAAGFVLSLACGECKKARYQPRA